MEKQKSTTESKVNYLREVIAEFDLETKVNQIAVRCFEQILKKNKQAYEWLQESEKKFIEFETRLSKTQNFASSIENNVNSKMEVTSSLNSRLQQFSADYYASLKEKESELAGMRKDYDNVMTATQRNTYDIRALTTDTRKNESRIEEQQKRLQHLISENKSQVNELINLMQKQIIEVRAQSTSLTQVLSEVKIQFMAKGTGFQQVSKDIASYIQQKTIIERRLNDIVAELKVKENSSSVNEMRLYFDSQITTMKDKNNESIRKIQTSINSQSIKTQKKFKSIEQESSKRLLQQQNANKQLQQKINKNISDIDTKMIKLKENLEQEIQKTNEQLTSLTQLQQTHLQQTQLKINIHSSQIKQLKNKTSQIELFQKKRHEELAEAESNIISMNKLVTNIMNDNQKRKKEMEKLQSAGQSNSPELIQQLHREISTIKQRQQSNLKLLETMQNKEEEYHKVYQQQFSILKDTILKDKHEVMNKTIEINDKLSIFSEQTSKRITLSQQTTQKYTDNLKAQILEKLSVLNDFKKQIQQLVKQFQQQTSQTQSLNKSISEKVQKSNAVLTKFKSDFVIRIQNVANDTQRRALQTKELTKMLEELRKHISNQTQGLNLSLCMQLSRQLVEEAFNTQSMKLSSLIEGWVFESEQKNCKYRGEHVNRKRMLNSCLNYLITQGDKVKGTLIQSGKDIFERIIQDRNQIFSARKRIITKRAGSQLPKLHL